MEQLMGMRATDIALKGSTPRETERLICIVALGLVEALQAGRISTAEACDSFFVPAFLKATREGWHPGVTKMLHAGSELEDVETLVPQELLNTLGTVKTRALAALAELPLEAREHCSRWLSE
jgi:Protein of unknown function (DUF3969)